MTLTEISVASKKVALWAGILFIVYLVLKLVIGSALQYYKASKTPPIPPPNVAFGKLPRPRFPETPISGFKFILENIEGRPPETTPAGKVYYMPKKAPNLFSAQRAKNFAASLGFTAPPKEITSSFYAFVDPQDPLRTLEIDIISQNYKLKYDWKLSPHIFFEGQLTSQNQILAEIKDYIGSNAQFDNNLLAGETTIELLKYDLNSKTLITATSLSNANAIRVNFFRPRINSLKVVSAQFKRSYNYVLFTPSNLQKSRYLEIVYTYWPIDFTNFATYPLISGETAWQNFLAGEASVIHNENKNNEIVIRQIYLAYYDSEEPQMVIQPIFVFEGDGNFVAYLPAIDPSWLE